MRIGVSFLALWVGLTAGTPARAEGAGLRTPVRLTAGDSNQMMGSLSPDGSALFFVSDQNATAELFVQRPVDSGPRLLFETNGVEPDWLMEPQPEYYLRDGPDRVLAVARRLLDQPRRPMRRLSRNVR